MALGEKKYYVQTRHFLLFGNLSSFLNMQFWSVCQEAYVMLPCRWRNPVAMRLHWFVYLYSLKYLAISRVLNPTNQRSTNMKPDNTRYPCTYQGPFEGYSIYLYNAAVFQLYEQATWSISGVTAYFLLDILLEKRLYVSCLRWTREHEAVCPSICMEQISSHWTGIRDFYECLLYLG